MRNSTSWFMQLSSFFSTSRRYPNLFIWGVLSICIGCNAPKTPEEAVVEPPNIVLIIADDMNWNDCGAYGHPNIQTPNIDALATAGMRFDRGYVTASSCSPSRASIITGKYPHNTGAEQLHWPIPEGTTTFVQQLKANGYYTAAAGKWHMGPHIRQHFDTVREANVAGFQLPTGASKETKTMVAPEPSGCEHWVSMLENRPKNQPFFMWFAALDPHRAYEEGILEKPHSISDVQVPPYLPDVPEVREDLRMYYDEIGRLDAYVGEVVAELKAQGVEEQTLILFISDNGRPFPRDKTTLYEGGIKTPWIVKWPAQVAEGSVSQSLVSTVDISSTFLELAGLTPLDKSDGVSFLPVLTDPGSEPRKYVFGEDHWHDFEDHGRAIISEEWKLIRNTYGELAGTPPADALRSPTFKAMLQLKAAEKLTEAQFACFRLPRGEYELYKLSDDPNELHNLIHEPAYALIREELKKALNDWGQITGDFIPTQRTPDEFDRVSGEPIPSVRKRPRPDKKVMFGTYGAY
ncbi:MAG: sulfatase [Bacteroidota bacterium]